MIETAFTRLLGLRAPIQLAPLPFHGAPDLAVAVAEAGGLGMIGTPLLAPEALAALLDAMRARTEGSLGANFLMPFLDPACVEAAAPRVRSVEFFYAEPDAALVARARRAGAARIGWQVGSADEARAAEDAGCDYVVAQGVEAGGHVRGRMELLPLLRQVVEALRCPVVAAGGIGRAEDLAAVLDAGASAARLGTRFLAAREADLHPRYLDLLLAASADDTVLTGAFSRMWPDAPHRVLRSAVEAAEALADDVVGEMPTPDGPLPVQRLSAISPTRDTTGRIEAMALYAGRSVAAVERVSSAAEIVQELVEGAEALRAGAGRR